MYSKSVFYSIHFSFHPFQMNEENKKREGSDDVIIASISLAKSIICFIFECTEKRTDHGDKIEENEPMYAVDVVW